MLTLQEYDLFKRFPNVNFKHNQKIINKYNLKIEKKLFIIKLYTLCSNIFDKFEFFLRVLDIQFLVSFLIDNV